MQIFTTPYVLPAVSGSAVVVNGHQLLSHPPDIPLPHAPSTPSRDAGLPPPDIRACRRRASRAIVCIREPGTSAAACGLAIICIWVIAASISILQEVVLQF